MTSLTQVMRPPPGRRAQAEVGLRDLLAAQLARGALEHQAALEHADDAIGDGGGPRQVLLDEDQRGALGDHVRERAVDILDRQRREAERDLVEQQQARVGYQRAPDRGRLLLASGQRRGALVAQPREHREGLDHGLDRPAAGPFALRGDPQVLLDRERREEPPTLGDQRDPHLHAAVGGDAGDVGAVEADRARARPVGAGDRTQKRRLAGAVGADQRHGLPLGDAEGEVADRLEQAVAQRQMVERQQAHAAAPPR